jgi:hypothetical protein
MREQRAVLAALLGAFVVLSLLADRGAATQRVITGTVIEWQVAESISVANEQTDAGGVRLALRETVYEGDAGAIKPGVRVTIWYRSVGERRPVADKVRVLAAGDASSSGVSGR